MAQTDRTRIPATLDEPEKLAFWTIDEFIVLIGGFMVGIVLSRFVEGILAGFVGVWALKKFKKGESLNLLRYAAYWVLPSSLFAFKRTLSSYKRDLAG
jgi:conjugal transfer pilus assembly protein TraL